MDEAELIEYLREQIDLRVRSGYGTAAEVMARLEEQIRDELRNTDGSAVPGLLEEARRALEEMREVEATWTEVTMNDRIDLAFEDLREADLVALQNAGYTMSDGWEDVAEARLDQPRAWGATFFHGQDVDRGVRGRGLMLAFGAFATGDAHERESLKVAREVCDTLTRSGVPNEWDGSIKKRIHILPFEWRRRRFTAPPR